MKISIYELLGMVKDGKAPKKIKYDGMIWKFEEDNLYYSDNVWLDDYCNISQTLNDTVEILEEPKGIPEKLYQCRMDTDNNEIEFLLKNINIIIDRYNDLLDYLESKEE